MLDAAMVSPTVVSTLDDQLIPAPTWTLADLAWQHLREVFADRKHDPSTAHWGAFDDILGTLAAMADGTAEPCVYFAPVSPGLGKSTAVQAMARALVDLPAYRDIGMVICVGRVAEAVDYAKELGSKGVGRHVAVVVSRGNAKKVREAIATAGAADVLTVTGKADDLEGELAAGDRQILVTTQARVAQATKRCGFRAVRAFHFRGQARPVVAWDESFAYGREVTIDSLALAGLWTFADRVSPAFCSALQQLTMRLPTEAHESIVEIPDWTAEFGVEEGALVQAFDAAGVAESDDRRLTATTLFMVAGQSVRVYHERGADERASKVLLSYKDTLPSDLQPVLVLDASALVRTVYDNNVEFRAARKLRAAQQDYSSLRVHVWTRGGGKSAFRKNGDQLVTGIVETIKRSPPEDKWLVVHHQGQRIGFKKIDKPTKDDPTAKMDGFEAAIRASLPDAPTSRVRFTTWGAHQACNDYRDCAHVVLAGTLFLPEAQYVALTHSSTDRSPAMFGLASADDVRRVRDGEHRHAILQAALRGKARQAKGDTCAEADVYVIASSTSGVPATIPQTFPGCQVLRWCPIEPELRGRLRDAATTLDQLIAEGVFDEEAAILTFGQLCERLPRSGRAAPRADAFMRDVASRPQWQDILSMRELVEVPVQSRRGRPSKGLRRASEARPAEEHR